MDLREPLPPPLATFDRLLPAGDGLAGQNLFAVLYYL